MSIGDRLKEARKNCGFTQEQLSELAGVARENIGRYETGKSQPSIDVLLRLADALNVSTDFLFERTVGPDLPPKKSMREILDDDPETAHVKTVAAHYDGDVSKELKQEIARQVKEGIEEYHRRYGGK